MSRDKEEHTINLFFTCCKLPPEDFFRKRCLQFRVAMKEGSKDPVMVKSTECKLWNTSYGASLGTLEFTETVRVTYKFEALQELFVSLYNVDGVDGHATEDEGILISSTKVRFPMLVAKVGIAQDFTLLVSDDPFRAGEGSEAGKVRIQACEIDASFGTMRMVVECELKKGISTRRANINPFLVVTCERADGLFETLFQSKALPRNDNPVWQKVDFEISRQLQLSYTTLRFTIYNRKSQTKSKFLGETDVFQREILSYTIKIGDIRSNASFDILELPVGDKTRKTKGTIMIRDFSLDYAPTFLDFVSRGLEIDLVIAIDFTLSNGNPHSPHSLHNTSSSNSYIKAVSAVSNVLSDYDTDNLYPVFGFGAKVGSQDSVSHCFPLTFSEKNVGLVGMDGVIESYKAALEKIVFAGPTYLSHVIRRVCDYATVKVTEGKDAYFILLIITDGQISDLNSAVEEIIKASALPISIVIVGLGLDDFSLMDYLDSDTKILRSIRNKDQVALRDIVQFVPYAKYQGDMAGLASATLEELPAQIVEYMVSKRTGTNGRVSM